MILYLVYDNTYTEDGYNYIDPVLVRRLVSIGSDWSKALEIAYQFKESEIDEVIADIETGKLSVEAVYDKNGRYIR
jgi:hypothetical protein